MPYFFFVYMYIPYKEINHQYMYIHSDNDEICNRSSQFSLTYWFWFRLLLASNRVLKVGLNETDKNHEILCRNYQYGGRSKRTHGLWKWSIFNPRPFFIVNQAISICFNGYKWKEKKLRGGGYGDWWSMV